MGLFQKLAYFKNWPISKIDLFQTLAYFKIFARALIIGTVTFFRKKAPQLLERHYMISYNKALLSD